MKNIKPQSASSDSSDGERASTSSDTSDYQTQENPRTTPTSYAALNGPLATVSRLSDVQPENSSEPINDQSTEIVTYQKENDDSESSTYTHTVEFSIEADLSLLHHGILFGQAKISVEPIASGEKRQSQDIFGMSQKTADPLEGSSDHELSDLAELLQSVKMRRRRSRAAGYSPSSYNQIDPSNLQQKNQDSAGPIVWPTVPYNQNFMHHDFTAGERQEKLANVQTSKPSSQEGERSTNEGTLDLDFVCQQMAVINSSNESYYERTVKMFQIASRCGYKCDISPAPRKSATIVLGQVLYEKCVDLLRVLIVLRFNHDHSHSDEDVSNPVKTFPAIMKMMKNLDRIVMTLQNLLPSLILDIHETFDLLSILLNDPDSDSSMIEPPKKTDSNLLEISNSSGPLSLWLNDQHDNNMTKADQASRLLEPVLPLIELVDIMHSRALAQGNGYDILNDSNINIPKGDPEVDRSLYESVINLLNEFRCLKFDPISSNRNPFKHVSMPTRSVEQIKFEIRLMENQLKEMLVLLQTVTDDLKNHYKALNDFFQPF